MRLRWFDETRADRTVTHSHNFLSDVDDDDDDAHTYYDHYCVCDDLDHGVGDREDFDNLGDGFGGWASERDWSVTVSVLFPNTGIDAFSRDDDD